MNNNAKQIWKELADIPVDENDNIEKKWKHFPIETSKFEIWHWIEETYNVSIAKDLMQL